MKGGGGSGGAALQGQPMPVSVGRRGGGAMTEGEMGHLRDRENGTAAAQNGLERRNSEKKEDYYSNCRVCLGTRDGDSILLCDSCERGFHIYCLNPPLDAIPPGDWFCPRCVRRSRKLAHDQGRQERIIERCRNDLKLIRNLPIKLKTKLLLGDLQADTEFLQRLPSEKKAEPPKEKVKTEEKQVKGKKGKRANTEAEKHAPVVVDEPVEVEEKPNKPEPDTLSKTAKKGGRHNRQRREAAAVAVAAAIPAAAAAVVSTAAPMDVQPAELQPARTTATQKGKAAAETSTPEAPSAAAAEAKPAEDPQPEAATTTQSAAGPALKDKAAAEAARKDTSVEPVSVEPSAKEAVRGALGSKEATTKTEATLALDGNKPRRREAERHTMADKPARINLTSEPDRPSEPEPLGRMPPISEVPRLSDGRAEGATSHGGLTLPSITDLTGDRQPAAKPSSPVQRAQALPPARGAGDLDTPSDKPSLPPLYMNDSTAAPNPLGRRGVQRGKAGAQGGQGQSAQGKKRSGGSQSKKHQDPSEHESRESGTRSSADDSLKQTRVSTPSPVRPHEEQLPQVREATSRHQKGVLKPMSLPKIQAGPESAGDNHVALPHDLGSQHSGGRELSGFDVNPPPLIDADHMGGHQGFKQNRQDQRTTLPAVGMKKEASQLSEDLSVPHGVPTGDPTGVKAGENKRKGSHSGARSSRASKKGHDAQKHSVDSAGRDSDVAKSVKPKTENSTASSVGSRQGKQPAQRKKSGKNSHSTEPLPGYGGVAAQADVESIEEHRAKKQRVGDPGEHAYGMAEPGRPGGEVANSGHGATQGGGLPRGGLPSVSAGGMDGGVGPLRDMDGHGGLGRGAGGNLGPAGEAERFGSSVHEWQRGNIPSISELGVPQPQGMPIQANHGEMPPQMMTFGGHMSQAHMMHRVGPAQMKHGGFDGNPHVAQFGHAPMQEQPQQQYFRVPHQQAAQAAAFGMAHGAQQHEQQPPGPFGQPHQQHDQLPLQSFARGLPPHAGVGHAFGPGPHPTRPESPHVSHHMRLPGGVQSLGQPQAQQSAPPQQNQPQPALPSFEYLLNQWAPP